MSKIKDLRERMEETRWRDEQDAGELPSFVICPSFGTDPLPDRSKQEQKDFFNVGHAQYMSTGSKDPSTKVGAVIVRPNNSVASVGFNGFPSGSDDSPELYADREYKLSRIIHAELNALIFAREPLAGYTMYVYPFMCCDKCYAIIKQAGIKRIVAPIPTDAQEERWGPAFEKVRSYAAKDGVELIEIEYND